MKKLYCVTTEINHGDWDNSFDSLASALDYIKNHSAITDVIDCDAEIAVVEVNDDDDNAECIKVYSAAEVSEMLQA